MYEYETSKTKLRLSTFLKEIGSNNNQFVVKMGYAATFLNSKSGISEDKLTEISIAYPELNMNWLLTGDGDMFKPTVQGATLNNVSGNVTANTAGHVGGNVDMRTYNAEKIIRKSGDVELYGDAQPIIEKLEIENKALTQRIADLEKIIDMKDKLISMLEEKIKS
ncbi:MAG: hypothetical protein HDQ88_07240 [Clostridia bacterium]|nr:hypothetical protein [Clostridia bacterium]